MFTHSHDPRHSFYHSFWGGTSVFWGSETIIIGCGSVLCNTSKKKVALSIFLLSEFTLNIYPTYYDLPGTGRCCHSYVRGHYLILTFFGLQHRGGEMEHREHWQASGEQRTGRPRGLYLCVPRESAKAKEPIQRIGERKQNCVSVFMISDEYPMYIFVVNLRVLFTGSCLCCSLRPRNIYDIGGKHQCRIFLCTGWLSD